MTPNEAHERRLEYRRKLYQKNRDSVKEQQQEYYRKNSVRIIQRSRNNRLLKRYNLTPERYEEMLERQNGVCLICLLPPTKSYLAVDHDRTCCPGDVSCGLCIRGLLHNKCNSFLGWYERHKLRIESYLTKRR